jgi:hypothetical protein
MCKYDDSFNWLTSLLLPILIGLLLFYLARLIDENSKRKNLSILGVIILNSLLEEVKNGLGVIESIANQNLLKASNIPIASWVGIKTIPDDVLLRIIAVSKKPEPEGNFQVRDILTHTKNYFEHMCITWNNFNELVGGDVKKQTMSGHTLVHMANDFITPTRKVKILIERTIKLLNKNSKGCYHK